MQVADGTKGHWLGRRRSERVVRCRSKPSRCSGPGLNPACSVTGRLRAANTNGRGAVIRAQLLRIGIPGS